MRTSSTACRPLGFIEPCLPTLGPAVPNSPLWVHETKHDGYRFICRRDGGRVRVISRHGLDWTDRVPSILEALRSLRLKSATIDGEAVVCNERGISQPLPPSTPSTTQVVPTQTLAAPAQDHAAMSHGSMPMSPTIQMK
jgi:ATP dependent DNA ligase domain